MLKARRKGLTGKPLGAVTTRAQLLLSKTAEGGCSTQHLGSRGFKDGSGNCTHESGAGDSKEGKLDHSLEWLWLCGSAPHPSQMSYPSPDPKVPSCFGSACQPFSTPVWMKWPSSYPTSLSGPFSPGESCCRCRERPAGRDSCSAVGSDSSTGRRRRCTAL